MNLEKYKYCYLNNIYNKENSIYFELVLTDSLFTSIAKCLVDESVLCEINKNTNLVKDFIVTDGIFKSNVVKTASELRCSIDDLNVLHELPLSSGSLFDLIREGAMNNYLLLDSDFDLTQEEYIGHNVTQFNKIRASDTTMSLYARFITPSGVYNRMLLTVENGNIKSHKFKFAVPITYKSTLTNDLENRFLGIKYLKTMKIVNQDYRIYSVDMMQIYTKYYIFKPLINKAVSMHMKCQDSINSYSYFISRIYKKVNVKNEESKPWIGGSHDYKDNYGIYFSPNRSKLPTKRIRYLYNFLEEKIEHNADIKQAIVNVAVSTTERAVLMSFYNLFKAGFNALDLNTLDQISAVYKQKSSMETFDVFFMLFLYEIRINLFAKRISLVEKLQEIDSSDIPIIDGSDEKMYTTVLEDFPKKEITNKDGHLETLNSMSLF